MIAILLLVFSIFIVLGVPTVFSMGIALIPAVLVAQVPFNMIIQKIVLGCESFVLLAIPLFIYAGTIMDHSGITANLVNLAKALIGFVRGGLGMSVVVGEMFFSGISGSTAADVSAIGALLLPSLDKAGYPKKYSISPCSNSIVLKIEFPGVISLRKLFPSCAIPNGRPNRAVSKIFLKSTNIPWTLSGRK